MRSILFAAGASLLLALPAPAQQGGTITPGMNGDEVRAVFGSPAVVRDQGEWRYLFYTNRCLPRCGSDDVVFLRDGRVVAAVLRSPERRFTGAPAAAVLQTMQPEPGSEAAAGTPAGDGGQMDRPDSARGASVRGIRIQAPEGAQPAPAQPNRTQPNRTQPNRAPTTNLGVIRGRAPEAGPTTDSLRADTTAGPVGSPADTAGARRNPPPLTNPAALPPPPRGAVLDTVRGGMRPRPQ